MVYFFEKFLNVGPIISTTKQEDTRKFGIYFGEDCYVNCNY